MSVTEKLIAAKQAARSYGGLSLELRHAVLRELGMRIEREQKEILLANQKDLTRERSQLSEAKLSRLALDEAKIGQLVDGIKQIIALPDPLGRAGQAQTLPSGINVSREAIPIGLIGMIFEARPNVVVDVFALCFKAGNGCVLKAGKEATESAKVLYGLVQEALSAVGQNEKGVVLIASSDREVMKEVLAAESAIDVIIPRGGESLIQFVTENTRIPVLRHAKGICHLFVEKSAQIENAIPVILNAKLQAPATCNALETLLLDEALDPVGGTKILEALSEHDVELRGCARTRARFKEVDFSPEPPVWEKEYLDRVLNVRSVSGVQAACDHIVQYGSNHTDAILTEDPSLWEVFRKRVTSSCVLWNTTTRFNDGFQLGLGAELGINTTKLHAYGPMGLESLTVSRFVVEGQSYPVRT